MPNRRIAKKYVCQCNENQWIIEVLKQSHEEEKCNSSLSKAICKALNAIMEWQEEIKDSQTQKIHRIGPRISRIIEDKRSQKQIYSKLSQHDLQSTPPVTPPRKRSKPQSPHTPPRKRSKTTTYIPSPTSAARAILLGLSKNGSDTALTQSEVARLAQPFCATDFNAQGYGLRIPGWAGHKTLIKHKLLKHDRDTKKYSLTETGHQLGKDILSLHDEKTNVQFGTNILSIPSKYRTYDLTKPIIIHNQPYYLYLNIDPRESSGTGQSKQINIYKELMNSNNILVCNKTMSSADFTWLLMSRAMVDGEKSIVIVGPTVERKTGHDLYHSIQHDHRYQKQKYVMDYVASHHRLMNARKMYLLEGGIKNEAKEDEEERCQQALVDTECIDGYFVCKTDTKRDTLRWLVNWTYRIRKYLDFDTMLFTSFEEFNSYTQEELITDLDFDTMLRTLDDGIDERISFYIRDVYATVKELCDAYASDGGKRGELLLHDTVRVYPEWKYICDIQSELNDVADDDILGCIQTLQGYDDTAWEPLSKELSKVVWKEFGNI